jgi:dTDP-4-dehydrorhamnose reductase
VEAAIERHQPEPIYLAAALTGVDYCEDHQDEAWRINVEGTRNVAEAAARVGSKLIFYSTEYVFDGAAGPYAEDDPVSPLGVYAQSKAAGEETIRDAADDYLIVRTTVVFGWDRASRNFAMQLWEHLSVGDRMRVPYDQIGNPTLVDFLAETSLALVRIGVRGETINVVGGERVARSDFAVRLADRLRLDSSLIDPVSTASLNQRAARPLDAGLRTDKLASILGTPAIGLDVALDRFVTAKEADQVPTRGRGE